LPVTVDAEGTGVRLYALQSLLDGIDSYLDSLGWSAPLDASSLPAKGAPYVDVRSEEESERENYPPTMILSTRTPSAPWRDSLSHIAEEAAVEYVLYVSLGLSEYSKQPLNSPEVELGTGYKIRLGWTKSGEPLAVVHIKGMLLDRNGKIVRAGAEGIIARDTDLGDELLYGVFGSDADPSISADDIAGLSTEERREDLPGQPLKWKVATQNLLAQLLMREEVLRD
jgi:hypothetical protein